jgi:hypothetical protein
MWSQLLYVCLQKLGCHIEPFGSHVMLESLFCGGTLPNASLLALLAPWYLLQASIVSTALFRDFI